jgi:hypothetical protein
LRPNQLIEEIKNEHYQSPNVIYYLSIVLDINLLILSSHELELYYKDDLYDHCKPHVILYKDKNQIYYPIFYQTDDFSSSSQFLNYYDHSLIRCIIDNMNKKVICHKNYIKNPPQSTTTGLKETVIELRKIAEAKGIEIRKMSEVSGRRVYKTKSELLADLEL